MKIKDMKLLRSVARETKVYNLLDTNEILGLVDGHVEKVVEYGDSHWVMVFEVMHNNTLYMVLYRGDKGPRMTYDIDWMLVDVVSLKSGKPMRKKDACIMLENLYAKGQVKTYDTSDIVLNYKDKSNTSFASCVYNDVKFEFSRTPSGLLRVTSETQNNFIADTIKEAKIGIIKSFINQNK